MYNFAPRTAPPNGTGSFSGGRAKERISYYIISYYIIPYNVILDYIILYYIVLYCIIINIVYYV